MHGIAIAQQRIRNWTPGNTLDLSNLCLTSLPDLPTTLTTLYCYDNQLTLLPDTLPVTLTELYCDNNQLRSLPDTLPATLTELSCDNNLLTSLPDALPSTLTHLWCSYNQLQSLPDTLPATLTELYCGHNRLTSLSDTLPAILTILDCDNNPIPVRDHGETIANYVTKCHMFVLNARRTLCLKIAEDLRELHTELVAAVLFMRHS